MREREKTNTRSFGQIRWVEQKIEKSITSLWLVSGRDDFFFFIIQWYGYICRNAHTYPQLSKCTRERSNEWDAHANCIYGNWTGKRIVNAVKFEFVQCMSEALTKHWRIHWFLVNWRCRLVFVHNMRLFGNTIRAHFYLLSFYSEQFAFLFWTGTVFVEFCVYQSVPNLVLSIFFTVWFILMHTTCTFHSELFQFDRSMSHMAAMYVCVKWYVNKKKSAIIIIGISILIEYSISHIFCKYSM